MQMICFRVCNLLTNRSVENTEIQLQHFILFRIKKKSSESVIKEKSLQEGIYKIRF